MSVAKASLYEHPLKVVYHFLKIDTALFMALIILCMSGLVVLYSASGGDMDAIQRQLVRLGIGFAGLLIFAQIPADQLRSWSLWLYLIGVGLLVLVLVSGETGKGCLLYTSPSPRD